MSQTTDTQTETWESNSQILVGNDCECYFQNTHYVTINNIAFMHMISMSDVIYFTLKICFCPGAPCVEYHPKAIHLLSDIVM